LANFLHVLREKQKPWRIIMKIEQGRIDPLLQQDQAQKTQGKLPGESFGDFMAREAAQAFASQVNMPVPPPGIAAGFDPRFVTGDVLAAATLSQEDAAGAVSGGLNGLLNELTAYALELGRGGAPLRDAHGRLEDIESRLTALKADPAAGQVLAQNRGLAGIANELEVLAATERFKFNRGDYL
jgi:hypothetical protein